MVVLPSRARAIISKSSIRVSSPLAWSTIRCVLLIVVNIHLFSSHGGSSHQKKKKKREEAEEEEEEEEVKLYFC